MMYFSSLIVSVFLVSSVGFAQTADELAGEIERTYLSGEGIKAKFTFGSEGTITITTAVNGSAYLLQTPTMMVLNDGTTITSFPKHRQTVTISDAPKNSTSKAADLLRIRQNYSAYIRSQNKTTITLALIPKTILSESYSQMKIDSLHCTVQKSQSGNSIVIKGIRIFSSDESPQPGKLEITPIKKIAPGTFTFTPPKDAKIIDIRE